MSKHDTKVLERTKTDCRQARQSNVGCQLAPIGFGRSSKIQDVHLNRLAIIYVRQSSPHQVLENRESRERQYALADFAKDLGWPEDRVLVIDEDQGTSGRSSENRGGFQRLLGEVAMDHVGIVLGLELNRLSRSNKDWYHLMEVCGVFNTLLGDQDGLYDATDSNDRLLLGMKGAMGEFELVTLRNRLERGRQNKAERGDLVVEVPVGYLKLPSGEVMLEPDQQAREVVQLIFEKFEELGSAWAVFRYFAENNIRLGFRIKKGPHRGQLQWRRAQPKKIVDVLHHPIYAGAYVYGIHGTGRKNPLTGRNEGGALWLPPEQARVFLTERLPSYISWDQYQRNQQQLKQNRSLPNEKGIPRRGEALLGGLVTCGTCGHHLHPTYPEKKKPHYTCNRHLEEGRPQKCYGLKAAELDELVAQQVLLALEPASLELSLQSVENIERERQRLHRHWKQQLQRCQYEANRAEQQYQAVDPENRMVAQTLEQRWEEALRNQRQVQEEYDRFLQTTPAQLSGKDRDQIRALAENIKALWEASSTTSTDRKEMVRCLVDRVVVHVKQKSEYVDATIHWHGGFISQHEIVRPVGVFKQLRDYGRLMDRIEELYHAGHTGATIARKLNDEGFVPPRRKGVYREDTVRSLMLSRGWVGELNQGGLLESDEWWVRDLARELEIHPQKVYYWVERGWVHSRRTPSRHHLVIWADRAELDRLHKLKLHCRSWSAARVPELTTPARRSQKK
jgi:DNA invertase Pin-like site-specific DNA recombinase